MKYSFLISEEVVTKINNYKQNLLQNKLSPGAFLKKKLSEKNLSAISSDQFLELLIQTKKPQIFAESEVLGDGRDWNIEELSILGDVSLAAPVTIYDNGVHKGDNIKVHETPLKGELLFVPGALLKNEQTGKSPDITELVGSNHRIDDEKFYQLYERRLMPSLIHASQSSEKSGGALITIPGMGCGAFAGNFQGQLERKIDWVVEKILINHHDKLKGIKGVIFDPNQNPGDCPDSQRKIGNIDYIVKSGEFGTKNSQLKNPAEYGEQFKDTKLFSIVAWDHVSWPGNDFYIGSRETDDGVKAAATDICQTMTVHSGQYDAIRKGFYPSGLNNWKETINQNNVVLQSQGNTLVLDKQYSLHQFGSPNSVVAGFEALSMQSANNNITLYSANQNQSEGNRPRLAMKFSNCQQKNNFIQNFWESIRMTQVEGNDNTIYIEPSSGIGETGAYISVNDELAIKFADNNIRDKFVKFSGIIPSSSEQNGSSHCLAPQKGSRGDSAIYFNNSILPPAPDRAKNIATNPGQVQAGRSF